MQRILIALFLLTQGALCKAEARLISLRPESLSTAAAAWGDNQFLAADKKGNLFLLNGETLEIYPLLPSGALGKPSKLEKDPEAHYTNGTFAAAMSRDGESWAILEGYRPRLFTAGKEVGIGWPDYGLAAITFMDGDLVGLSLPHASGRRTPPAPRPDAPLPDPFPLLVTWNGKTWETLATRDITALKEGDAQRLSEELRGKIMAGADNRLWLAQDYRHRFQQFSPAGRLQTNIVVGRGRVEPLPSLKSAQATMGRVAEQMKKGKPESASVTSSVVTATDVAAGLTEGRDGRMYFLVSATAGDGMDLERYDAATGKVDRISLGMPKTYRASLAAGRDGLYIAPDTAKAGLWKLSWEALEGAKWKEIQDAKISGGGSTPESGP